MNFFKLFFLIILIVSFNNNVYGHGPSRQKVNEKIEIDANPEKVWEIVKNFMKYDWNSSIQKVIAENNEVGAERKLEFDGGKYVKQKLEKLDEAKKLISWRIVETSNEIMPVNSYAAKIFVKESENGKTLVNYKAGFYRGFMGNDPPESLNDENSKKKVAIFIKNSLKGLKSIAESK
jgi:carbon monoxide dehydrogenase subunit G|tara:strand:+ start:259 stop:789 length:531 start_codon:yes stop_codon:yes gene_type:complete